MLVDSHCHLTFPQLEEDRAGVLLRAEEAGVRTMLTISCNRQDFSRVRKLANNYQQIYCTIGVHPHDADTHQDITVEELLDQTEDPRVIGLGETGLDYFYENSARDAQRAVFLVHIEAARKSQLPLVIHSRDADEKMIQILKKEYEKGAFPFLLHCFSSGPELAREAITLGGYISMSGIITFKNSDELRAIAASVPKERLLVETDAPFLAPTPHRGKTNEPSLVRYTAEKLADIHGIDYPELAQLTTDNFFRLFSRANRLT